MTETTTPPDKVVIMETPVAVVPPKKGMSTGVKVLIGCGAFILLAVICFVIASALGLAGLSKVATEIDNSTQASADAEKTAFDNPSKLNEAVVVEDVQWTLTQASDLGSTLKSTYSYGDDCVANSGKFIKVVVKVKNNSSSMVSVTDLNLYDSAKNEYVSSSDVYGCTTDDLFILSNVNPGIEETFTAIYEVPSTSSGFKVKVSDLNLFSAVHKYISLGF